MRKQLSAEELEDIVGGVDLSSKIYGTLIYKEHALGQELSQITFAPYPLGTDSNVINNYFVNKLSTSGRIFVEFRPAKNYANA